MLLNIGCGDILLEGFVNIDIRQFPDIECLDIRQGLPYANESVEGITVSHALSRIEKEYYPEIFRELYRVMKVGGVIRITDDNHDQTPERITELNFDNPEVVGETSPAVTRMYLEDAGFDVFDVGIDETYFTDSSLIQVNYNRVDEEIYFHIEGIKNE